MDQQEIEGFRTRLLEQRAEVNAQVSAHGSFPALEAGDNGNDLKEQATRAADNIVEAKVAEDRGKLLQKIDLALERLDAGTYGQCAHCGKAIPLERLRAKPSVSLCLACQQAKDENLLAGA
jgi:DnaK suppressor protein